MQLRSLIRDEKFLQSMPNSLMDELISIQEPIPMNIKSMVMDYCHEFNFKRRLVIDANDELRANNSNERMTSRKLSPVESREYCNDLALNFIRKYPQFKPIIGFVRIRDENFNVIDEIPIDEYLAEN
ncbi:MAG: hypothetical protein IKH85_07625 [Methanobrevibacter sp.]|uniref:hypothetical protein n=1 Tax=Methanobrevibacter sp. TaxID=66852 RepID=UPI0025E0FC65|nr:hypothetical protein [Methanobrevibacter sp.]MBR6993928.1 hypothetical protein [Methanobrevibacter sp.]